MLLHAIKDVLLNQSTLLQIQNEESIQKYAKIQKNQSGGVKMLIIVISGYVFCSIYGTSIAVDHHLYCTSQMPIGKTHLHLPMHANSGLGAKPRRGYTITSELFNLNDVVFLLPLHKVSLNMIQYTVLGLYTILVVLKIHYLQPLHIS